MSELKHHQSTLLFCDTFSHTSLSEHVDSITFDSPIIIKQFRVVGKDHNPHPRKLDFHGRTQPKSFWLTVFCKQDDQERDNDQEITSYQPDHFSQITDPFPYKETIEDTFVPLKECITTMIAIRGNYTTLSLCIYGAVYNPTSNLPNLPNPSNPSNPSNPPSISNLPTISPIPPTIGNLTSNHLSITRDHSKAQIYEDSNVGIISSNDFNTASSITHKDDHVQDYEGDNIRNNEEIEREDGHDDYQTIQDNPVENSEEVEVEDESVASFINPLECVFGSVNSILGISGDSNPLSTVALCLMAFCNSLPDYTSEFSSMDDTADIKSICLLLERIAHSHHWWGSYSGEDHPENGALSGNIATGILGLFVSLEGLTDGNEEEWEGTNQSNKAMHMLLLRTACFAISICMKASNVFADEFQARGGVAWLLRFQQMPLVCLSSEAKLAILEAILHSISHPTCMPPFISYSSENENSSKHERDTQENLSAYEFTVNMLTVPQNPQVTLTIQQILQIVNFYQLLSLLQSNVDALVLGTGLNSSVWENITEQLNAIAECLSKISCDNEQTADFTIAMLRPNKNVPHQFIVMLQEMRFVHLLALLVSSFHSMNDMAGAIKMYGRIGKCLLNLLNSASLTKMLLDSHPDVLTRLIRSLVSLSACDFNTAGDLKPSFQLSDLLSLPICLANPNSVTPLNLAFLLAYHLQTLNELESLCESSANDYVDDQVGMLHSLYCMTFQDLGRYSVASGIAMAMCSSTSAPFPSLNMVDAPLDDASKYIQHIFKEVNRHVLLDTEKDTCNNFTQCFIRFISPPVAGDDIQVVPAVYALSLILQAVQCEELIDFCTTIGPTLHQIVIQWETKAMANVELKGRIQQILDWVYPTVILKEKGVVGLIYLLRTLAQTPVHSSIAPPSLHNDTTIVDSFSSSSLITDSPSIAESQGLNVAHSSSLAVNGSSVQHKPAEAGASATSNTDPISTPSEALNSIVLTHLKGCHLSTLITSLRLIAKLESPTVFIALAEVETLPFLVNIVKDVTATIDQAQRAKEDDKNWLSIKRERQFLELALASINVISMIVRKYLSSGVPFSSSEAHNLFTIVVQLYITNSRHPLFTLIERGDNQAHFMSGGSGHLPLLHKVSLAAVKVLGHFALFGEPWSNTVLSFVCSCAFELPRNFFGGVRLLSSIISLLPSGYQLCASQSTSLPSTLKQATVDQNENLSTLESPSEMETSEKELSDLLLSIDNKSEERTSFTPLLGVLISTIAASSSKRVHLQLCDTALAIAIRGMNEATTVISPIIEMLYSLVSNSETINAAHSDSTKFVPSASSARSTSSSHTIGHRVSSITRLLHLILTLTSSPHIRDVLSQKACLSALLQFIQLPQLQKFGHEAGNKHSFFVLAIVQKILLSYAQVNSNEAANENTTRTILHSTFEALSLSTLMDSPSLSFTCVHLLRLAASNRILCAALFQVSTTSNANLNRQPTLFFQLLKSFWSYMQLQQMQSHQQDAQTGTNSARGLSPETVFTLLQALLYIIEQVRLHSGNWRATAAFVDYFYASHDILVHPLIEIYNWLQKSKSRYDTADNESDPKTFMWCYSTTQQVLDHLNTTDSTSAISYASLTQEHTNNIEKKYNGAHMEFQKEKLPFYSTEYLDDSDFDDLVEPPLDTAHELQSVLVNSDERRSERTNEAGLEPPYKKPRAELGVTGPRVFSTTPSHFRRDPFRTRKPNTSRPPSTHVDSFVKKSSTSSDNIDLKNNKNIRDILIMDAKSREMRKEYMGKISGPRKELSRVSNESDRPMAAPSRWERPRDDREDREREKYQFPFSPRAVGLSHRNDSYGRSTLDIRNYERQIGNTVGRGHALPSSSLYTRDTDPRKPPRSDKRLNSDVHSRPYL